MSDHVFELDDDDVDPTLALEREQSGAEEPDAGDAEAPATGGADAYEDSTEQAPQESHARNLTRALQQERDRRKAAEAAAAQHREQVVRFEERMAAFQAFQRQQAEVAARQEQAKQAPVDPEPNKIEDPDGWNEWKIRELERQQQYMVQTYQAQQEQAQQYEMQRVQRERFQQLENRIGQYEQRLMASGRSDYMSAFNHVVESRAQYWAAIGVPDDRHLPANQSRMWQKLQGDRMQFLDNCFAIDQQGNLVELQDPAAAIYNLALHSGYAPGGAPQQAPQQQAVPQQRPDQRVQALQAGVQAARRQQPGGRPADAGGRMTIEKLIGMSDAEFYAFQQQNPGLVEELMS